MSDDNELRAIVKDNINRRMNDLNMGYNDVLKECAGRTPKITQKDLEDPTIEKFALVVIADGLKTSVKVLTTDNRPQR